MSRLLIFFLIGAAVCGDVLFYKEIINISIQDSSGSVEGQLFFKNISSQRRLPLIFFPFPLDETHPYPHEIKVEGYNYQICDSGIALIIDFKPEETKILKIFYRQNFRERSFTYIVKTVRDWKKPLDMAVFNIALPASLKNVKLNYKSTRIKKDSVNQVYKISCRKFYPKADLTIRWGDGREAIDKE